MEQRKNFAPYSRKGNGTKHGRHKSCTFKMVCLSGSSDNRVPRDAAMRENLIEAGLGARNVLVPDIDNLKEEFWDIIMSSYPKLKDCGGF